jgi:hypothetical protein
MPAATLIPAARELGPDPEPYGDRFGFLLAQARRPVAATPRPQPRRPAVRAGQQPLVLLRHP